MPLGESIVSQPIMATIITKVIKETLLHSGCFRISVNIAQSIQRPAKISFIKPAAVISLLPEVASIDLSCSCLNESEC